MKLVKNMIFGGAMLALPAFSASAGQPMQPASRPLHGMTMAKVTRHFGQPAKKVPAVGDPPISRWIYPDYVVYFEDNIVLHTVKKGKPFHDAPPAPVVHHIVSGDQG